MSDSRIVLAGSVAAMIAASAQAQVFFSEDFEGVKLGPSIDEEIPADNVWSNEPPEGWTIDNSGIPGFGDPDNDGVTEWAGWAFTDPEWWAATAGDQGRSEFTNGVPGVILVADPDEWDDLPHEPGTYNTFISTPSVMLPPDVDTFTISFDSSWRPEDDQKANITVAFDGGGEIEVLRWTSQFSCDPGDNFKPDATNETVEVVVEIPEGAIEVVVTFGMFDAGNDWWWAIDNVQLVEGGVLPPGDCDADINGDGILNILDFVAYQKLFQAGCN